MRFDYFQIKILPNKRRFNLRDIPLEIILIIYTHLLALLYNPIKQLISLFFILYGQLWSQKPLFILLKEDHLNIVIILRLHSLRVSLITLSYLNFRNTRCTSPRGQHYPFLWYQGKLISSHCSLLQSN
jgi:hypothetical protein